MIASHFAQMISRATIPEEGKCSAHYYAVSIVCDLSFGVQEVIRNLGSERVTRHLITALKRHKRTTQRDILKALKNISRNPSNLDSLHNSGLIERMCEMLRSETQLRKIDLLPQILNILFNLLRMSRQRQHEAISCGLLITLCALLERQQNFNQFSIPIMCELIGNSKSLPYLWSTDALAHLLSFADDVCWGNLATDTIIGW